MLTVVDQDIPFAAQAFAGLGDMRALPARELNAAALRDADALIVRSVTPVNAQRLDGSRLRFVGTATSGVDHVDLPYLRNRGIAFAHAGGANANAVAEYVVAALFHLSDTAGLTRPQTSLGIIGFGNVGRRVARLAAALGLRIVVNDPPLARSTCEPFYRPIEEALACDVVTVHVPLERAGPDPTHHLVNETFLRSMKPGAVLINTSRGAVADTAALKNALDHGPLGGLILDVWENEPQIDIDLARRSLIATAHIAGHTLDAKIAAVNILADALNSTVGAAPRGRPSYTRNPSEHHGDQGASPRRIPDTVKNCFDIAEADARLRETFALSAPERAAAFDALRAGWPARREFHVHSIALEDGSQSEMKTLQALGFRLAAATGAAPR